MENKTTYFKMVDQKVELEARTKELHDEYMEIWWGDDQEMIDNNRKESSNAYRAIEHLVVEMAEFRKDIPKETLKEWKNEYGTLVQMRKWDKLSGK
jgi:hypothetical protein